MSERLRAPGFALLVIGLDGEEVHFLKVRDQVKGLLKTAGAFRMDAVSMTGSSWLTMACLDRLVELKEIVPLRQPGTCWAQYQVYATPEVHNL